MRGHAYRDRNAIHRTPFATHVLKAKHLGTRPKIDEPPQALRPVSRYRVASGCRANLLPPPDRYVALAANAAGSAAGVALYALDLHENPD
jgi:hypothetical protein